MYLFIIIYAEAKLPQQRRSQNNSLVLGEKSFSPHLSSTHRLFLRAVTLSYASAEKIFC